MLYSVRDGYQVEWVQEAQAAPAGRGTSGSGQGLVQKETSPDSGLFRNRGDAPGAFMGCSYWRAARWPDRPIWLMPTRIVEPATDRGAVRSRACLRRRCPHGPGDGHDDAGHQQVPGPAHKHQRISPMPMLPSASSAVAPRLGPRQAAEHGALTHQRRVRADWAPSGCSISGEIGKHLLIDLADHAGSRRRVRGGARCDGGSLALAGRRILTNL